MADCDARQLSSSPEPAPRGCVRRRSDDLAGIYLHVPFCDRRCPYCNFAVDVRQDVPHREYADAVIEEFEHRKHWLDGRNVDTIYIGGGTPSLWRPSQLARVLDRLRDHAHVAPAEVCLEANPVDITADRLARWTDAGISRLSIGCQSFQPEMLDQLNRNHTRQQAIAAVELALAHGPAEVSLDLMFGNPDQTMDQWRRDLDQVETFAGLVHLSGYNLTIEPGTAFERRQRRGRLSLPDDDHCSEMLDYLVARCEQMGLMRYEVSNFSRPGHRSRHNTLYWTGAEYLGLGVGAHSLQIGTDTGVVRRANTRHTATFMDRPTTPESTETLTSIEHLTERLFLGIRTREGIDISELRSQFVDAVGSEDIKRAESLLESMCDGGFLEKYSGGFRPTHRGLNVADALAHRFFDAFDGSAA